MKKKAVSYTARRVTFLLQANRTSPLACPHMTLCRHFSGESCHHECTSPLCTIVTPPLMPGINTGPDLAPALLCGYQGSGIVYSSTSLPLSLPLPDPLENCLSPSCPSPSPSFPFLPIPPHSLLLGFIFNLL